MAYLKMSNLFFRKDPKEVVRAVEKSLDLAEYEHDALVTELKREEDKALASDSHMGFHEGDYGEMGFGFGADEDLFDGDELDDDDL